MPGPRIPTSAMKRRQHFIAAFANLIDSRVSHHSLQWKIDKISEPP